MLGGGQGEDWVCARKGDVGSDRPRSFMNSSTQLGDFSSPEYDQLSPFRGFKRP